MRFSFLAIVVALTASMSVSATCSDGTYFCATTGDCCPNFTCKQQSCVPISS
ncbi:hypothetical protein BDR05DRAFT_962896 [Suillus weaverae]|nr:hypothetical protein BDR05DRAFT_962896 [Suillus weaverae]